MIDFITAEEDIEAILRDETTCVISDSTYPTQGLVHPRVYGTYVRLFERYVRTGCTFAGAGGAEGDGLPGAASSFRQGHACAGYGRRRQCVRAGRTS